MDQGKNDSVGWLRCRAFLRQQGLPEPRLPLSLTQSIAPVREGLFATPGWRGGFELEASLAEWLEQAAPGRAWLGVLGHGVMNRSVCLAAATPRWGIFLRKRWRPDLHGEHGDVGRIEGSWQLLRRLQEAAEAAWAEDRWPRGRRLLLVEDELVATQWAWIEGEPAAMERREQPRAWWEALMAVDKLREPQLPGDQLGRAA